MVTVAALLGMAAHLEGKGVSVLDMAGLAQKYGAVTSHVRIANNPDDIHAVRIAAGEARLVLGCDLVVAASFDSLAKMTPDETNAIVNAHEFPTGEFTRQPDMEFPGAELRRLIEDAAGSVDFIDASSLAGALVGESIGTNLFLLGYAYQKGLLPISATAIERAIALNGVAVKMNRQAFRWGRNTAIDRDMVEKAAADAAPAIPADQQFSTTRDDVIARRESDLTAYQNAGYARRYSALVSRVQDAEAKRAKGLSGLTEAVARNYYKLLAYKDEYEVARLFTDGRFARQVNELFEGNFRLTFHMASPLFARPDVDSGRPRKITLGPWLMGVMRVLSGLRRLRGTPFDIFGYSRERREERRLIASYESIFDEITQNLDRGNHRIALEIASLPEHIRGYGPVKAAQIEAAEIRQADLLSAFRERCAPASAAE